MLNDTLRTNYFHKRVLVVSSPADDCKIYFALVRRDFFGLDDLHVVLPSRIAAWLLLFALCDQTADR